MAAASYLFAEGDKFFSISQGGSLLSTRRRRHDHFVVSRNASFLSIRRRRHNLIIISRNGSLLYIRRRRHDLIVIAEAVASYILAEGDKLLEISSPRATAGGPRALGLIKSFVFQLTAAA